MTSKSRGHCDNIKVFNQGKSNQIMEKSGNLIAKNVWPPCMNSHSYWQTVQIQISWLLKKPSDLGLHCLQRQDLSGFSKTRVKAT